MNTVDIKIQSYAISFDPEITIYYLVYAIIWLFFNVFDNCIGQSVFENTESKHDLSSVSFNDLINFLTHLSSPQQK